MKVQLNRLGGPTHDVKGIDFDVAKIALKFHPASPNPRLPAPIGPSFSCDDDAEVFDAPSQVRLQFGSTDARVPVGDHDTDREFGIAEVWLLVKVGTARVERQNGSSPLVTNHCVEDDGGQFEFVRAISSGQLGTSHDQTAVALIDIHATDVDVQTVQCHPTHDPTDNPACDEPDNRNERSSSASVDPTAASSGAPPSPVPPMNPPPSPPAPPTAPPPPKQRLGFSLRDLVVRAATQ